MTNISIKNKMEILIKASDKFLDKIAKEYSLTLIELKIIIFLHENEDNNLAKDITKYLGTTKSLISMSVSSLINKKMLTKKIDDFDKKKIRLFLTDKTGEIINKANIEKMKIKDIILHGITKEEIEEMNSILKKMSDNINKLDKDMKENDYV